MEQRKDSVVQFLARLKVSARNPVGTAASIRQSRWPFSAKPLQPLAHRAFSHLELKGDGSGLLPTINDSANN